MAYAATVTLVGVAVLIAAAVDRPVSDVTRDPIAVLDGPYYVGVISNASVLVWWSAAVGCLFAAAALARTRRRAALAPLAAAGALSALLALDDLFMIHDAALPSLLHVPEHLTYAGYGLVGAVLLAVFRRFVLATDWTLLTLAAAAFAASLGIDIFAERVFGSEKWALEDAVKLFGVVTWATYWLRTALRELAAGEQQLALVTPLPGADEPQRIDALRRR